MLQVALGGEWLHPWWQNWKEAKAHVVQGGGGHYSREMSVDRREDGLHIWVGKRYDGPSPELTDYNFEEKMRKPDCIMKWTEVRDIILAGSSPKQREEYQAGVRAYCHEHSSEGYDAAKRIGNEILRAGCDIFAKKAERLGVQDTLF